MHVFEVLIYIISITMIGLYIYKKPIKKIYVALMIFSVIVVTVLQIIYSDIRWQLYPVYLAVFMILVLVYLKKIANINFKKAINASSLITISLLLFISLISVIIFPKYDLPDPNGEYLIGTQSFIIEDESRYEMYSEDSNNFRRFKIQIWYPAETIEGYEQAYWLEDGVVVARALSNDFGFPSFTFDHTATIMSNSYINAPLSNDLDDYPVIILSHGWRGFRNLHTDYAEELASQGYIVVGIDHTYGSVATVFGDNDIAYLNSDALPERETTNEFLDYAKQLVYTYAGDITKTINYLEGIDDIASSSMFAGRLNLDRIGLLGHSTGGGADVAVALEDERIDALIGLDAWVEPIDQADINKGLTIPSLFIRSESWEEGENNAKLYDLNTSSLGNASLYQIDKTTHFDFAMVYMYSPLTNYIGLSGSINDEYLLDILKSMIRDFFDSSLRNNGPSEIDVDAWDEVHLIEIE